MMETRVSPTEPPLDQRRFFVIVTSQRTGSTLLIRSLDSAPRVYCAGEIFHTGPHVYHREFQYPHLCLGSRKLARLIDRFGSRQRVRNHLGKFYACAGAGAAAVGFKVMVSQIRAIPAIMPILDEQRVAFLYLYREDSFATALSYYKAKASGVFHSDRSDAIMERSPVMADEEEFRRLLADCLSDKLQTLQLHKMFGGRLLTYEDMVSHWDTFIATVGAEIGIQGLHVQKALSKLQAGMDSVRLVNEDSLRERFGGKAPVKKLAE